MSGRLPVLFVLLCGLMVTFSAVTWAASIQSVKNEAPLQPMRVIAVRVLPDDTLLTDADDTSLAYELEVRAIKKMAKKSRAQFIAWSSLSLSATRKPAHVERVLKEKAIEGVLTVSFMDDAIDEVTEYVPVTVQSETYTRTHANKRRAGSRPLSTTSTTTTTIYVPRTREIKIVKYKADLEDVSGRSLWAAFLVEKGGSDVGMFESIAAKTAKSLKKQKYIVK